MTNPSPIPTQGGAESVANDLVKRLRIKAGMMSMGELIAWGSDTALMQEAANYIEALAASQAAPAPQAVEELLGKYWELAFLEGSTGESHGSKAQAVLSAIRRQFDRQAAPAKAEGIPDVLFDGNEVYAEITRKLGKSHCHNHETVSATLDAVVRLMRRAAPSTLPEKNT